jgi:hypothetical protein
LAYNLPVLPKATDTRAWEVTQPPTRREQVRARAVAEIPRWYRPWGHLAFPSVVGLGLIAASIALLDHPTPLELLVVPLVLDDMAMRATREFRLVLIPFYGILAIFVTTLPITAALWWFVSRNVALLWIASTMGYVVAYEWLHLAYHLPESNPWSYAERMLMVKAAASPCDAPHPELMQRWNSM